jgi:hypothetical protein
LVKKGGKEREQEGRALEGRGKNKNLRPMNRNISKVRLK